MKAMMTAIRLLSIPAACLLSILPAAAQNPPAQVPPETVAPAAAPVAAPVAAAAPAERPRQALPIVEVTVYEDRALVTREGEVTVAGGVETILVGGLPPNLAETSLRAGLAGTTGLAVAGGRVISVSSEVERQREIQDTRMRAVEDERRTVARQIAAIDDDRARLTVREGYLAAYEKLLKSAISERTAGGGAAGADPVAIPRAGPGPGGDPGTAQWGEALKYIQDGRAAIAAAQREADQRREKLQVAHDDLAAQADKLRRPQERSTRTAEVVIEAPGAGKARLRVTYVIDSAGWVPRYDARFDAERGDLFVTYFGEIRQETGEDWTAARISLSTARPSVGANRPELLPLKLAAAPNATGAKGKGIAHRVEKTGEEVESEVRYSVDLASPAAPPERDLVTTASRETATGATFTVPSIADIPGDGRPHKVPVITFREGARTSFETAPRLQRFVYLKASSRNATSYPMLAGAVDIYRGSGFIGTARLKFVPPGNPFEISLGIEESLKVKRTVTFNDWTGRGKEKREGFDIEVANFGEKPQSVTVLDGFPVSDIEEVTVKLDSTTTPAAEKDEKKGHLKWKLEVPPGEARTVHLEYTIRYPKDYAGG